MTKPNPAIAVAKDYLAKGKIAKKHIVPGQRLHLDVVLDNKGGRKVELYARETVDRFALVSVKVNKKSTPESLIEALTKAVEKLAKLKHPSQAKPSNVMSGKVPPALFETAGDYRRGLSDDYGYRFNFHKMLKGMELTICEFIDLLGRHFAPSEMAGDPSAKWLVKTVLEESDPWATLELLNESPFTAGYLDYLFWNELLMVAPDLFEAAVAKWPKVGTPEFSYRVHTLAYEFGLTRRMATATYSPNATSQSILFHKAWFEHGDFRGAGITLPLNQDKAPQLAKHAIKGTILLGADSDIAPLREALANNPELTILVLTPVADVAMVKSRLTDELGEAATTISYLPLNDEDEIAIELVAL